MYEGYKKKWKKQLVKCIRCGSCRTVCPVFKVTKNENTTARGKVRLIEMVTEDKLDLTAVMQQRVSRCLLCKACVKGCPSGVKTDELFLSARKALAEKNGVPFAKRIAFTGLTYRHLFDFSLRMGSVFQKLIFRKTADGRGNMSRIPIPAAGLNERRIIPALAKRPLRSMMPAVNKASEPKARVAFFTGCMMNYVYPQMGQAIIKVLQKNNIEVVLPKAQCCCGTPAFTSGDFKVGQYLAQKNVELFDKGNYDAIITGCASCGNALKNEYEEVLEEGQIKEKWRKMSAKVHDISEYLVSIDYDKESLGTIKEKVTYHDPCHLVRGMKVTKQPRDILKNIPGVEFEEMHDADKCCGCGGSFSAVFYDISRKINDEKLDNAERTHADVLATGCPACRMHITDGLGQRHSKMKVRHPIEILADAYDAAEKEGKANG